MKISNLIRSNSLNSFYKFALKRNIEVIKTKDPIRINDLIIYPSQQEVSWNHNFFAFDSKISLPVFSLGRLNYTGENVVLDHDIFNQPLRKDLIHRVMLYNKEYNRKTFKWVKSKAEVSGSNRKPHAQKKTGRARQGCIRSPNLYHGGRAHGERPREFYFPLNKKVRLLALKSMLTAKLVDNRIIVVDKPKYTSSHPAGYKGYFDFLKGNHTLFITGEKIDSELNKLLKKNVPFVEHLEAATINVFKVLRSKYIILTKTGLEELMDILRDRKENYFRNKKLPKQLEMQDHIKTYNFKFNVKQPLKIYTPALRGSINKIIEDQLHPEILENKLIEEDKNKKLKIKEMKEIERQKMIESQYSDDSAIHKRRLQEKKLKKMLALKEIRRQKLKVQKNAKNAAQNKSK